MNETKWSVWDTHFRVLWIYMLLSIFKRGWPGKSKCGLVLLATEIIADHWKIKRKLTAILGTRLGITLWESIYSLQGWRSRHREWGEWFVNSLLFPNRAWAYLPESTCRYKGDPSMTDCLLFDPCFSNTVFSKDENYVTTDFCVTHSTVLLSLPAKSFCQSIRISRKRGKETGGQGGKQKCV